MPVHIPGVRVRKPAEDGDVLAQRFERIETLGEAIVLAISVGKPGPVRIGRIVTARHGDTIRDVKAGEALLGFGARGQSRGEGFEPRQRQSDAGSTDESSTINVGNIHGVSEFSCS